MAVPWARDRVLSNAGCSVVREAVTVDMYL
jgi:hypothetical protein